MHFLRKGTTLIELLIVIGIIGILASVTFLSLFGARKQNDLNGTSQNIAALLREARSRSVAQSLSTSWGVHFENSTATSPFYALFFSAEYGPTVTIGYYRLPSSVGYASLSIPSGSFKEVTFSQLNGLASVSTSVSIYLLASPTNSSTINIASSGAVSY